MLKERLKRAFDLASCVLALPLVLFVLAICAGLIKLESPGSVFFIQERMGRKRKRFQLIKLRTMIPNAEKLGMGLYTAENDPRCTRVGLLLRRFSLDELPQIFNVLKGSMSVVGPRPLPAAVVQKYPDHFDVILKAKPGITGLSQVNGRNALPRSKRLKLDMFYAENWSFRLDFQILLKTLQIVFTGKGQINYQGPQDVER